MAPIFLVVDTRMNDKWFCCCEPDVNAPVRKKYPNMELFGLYFPVLGLKMEF